MTEYVGEVNQYHAEVFASIDEMDFHFTVVIAPEALSKSKPEWKEHNCQEIVF